MKHGYSSFSSGFQYWLDEIQPYNFREPEPVSQGEIVTSTFVCRSSFLILIGFIEQEVARIINCLEHVETKVPRLLYRANVIFSRYFNEIINMRFFDASINK